MHALMEHTKTELTTGAVINAYNSCSVLGIVPRMCPPLQWHSAHASLQCKDARMAGPSCAALQDQPLPRAHTWAVNMVASLAGSFLESDATKPRLSSLTDTFFTLKPTLSPGCASGSDSWCISTLFTSVVRPLGAKMTTMPACAARDTCAFSAQQLARQEASKLVSIRVSTEGRGSRHSVS